MEAKSYTLKSTGTGSQKFGPCEICGEHVGETFLQRTRRHVFPDDPQSFACGGYRFGHKACLERVREC